MYIDNENFDKWMERLSKKLTEIGQDLEITYQYWQGIGRKWQDYSTIRI